MECKIEIKGEKCRYGQKRGKRWVFMKKETTKKEITLMSSMATNIS